jgi:16S rRNA (guanine527-N7)-methyltransferase
LRDRAPLPADPSLCQPLASATAARFDAGCAALGLGDLPPGGRDAILGHLRLLLAWTDAVNLTAIREPDAAVTGHLLDSLTAVPLLREAGVRRFLDLGSGGGYPGLPLALALPAEAALLVDSIAKKAAFLRVAVAAAGVAERVAVAAVRAETLAEDRNQRERWPAVTVRAVAPLPDLVELAFPLLVPGGLLVAWKRAGIDDERRRALVAVEALGGGTVEVVAPPVFLPGLEDHALVAVRKEGRTSREWPRPPAERKRRPW